MPWGRCFDPGPRAGTDGPVGCGWRCCCAAACRRGRRKARRPGRPRGARLRFLAGTGRRPGGCRSAAPGGRGAAVRRDARDRPPGRALRRGDAAGRPLADRSGQMVHDEFLADLRRDPGAAQLLVGELFLLSDRLLLAWRLTDTTTGQLAGAGFSSAALGGEKSDSAAGPERRAVGAGLPAIGTRIVAGCGPGAGAGPGRSGRSGRRTGAAHRAAVAARWQRDGRGGPGHARAAGGNGRSGRRTGGRSGAGREHAAQGRLAARPDERRDPLAPARPLRRRRGLDRPAGGLRRFREPVDSGGGRGRGVDPPGGRITR